MAQQPAGKDKAENGFCRKDNSMINTNISEGGTWLQAWSFFPLTDEEVEKQVNQQMGEWRICRWPSFYSNGTYSWILKKGKI
jgi:hypothetical protein